MDLGALFPWILFAHVFGAILAFGPGYTFMIIGAMGRLEPQHANFGVRTTMAISKRIVYPLAIFQGVTGVLLIVASRIDFGKVIWLQTGILLYAIALTYSLTIQQSAVNRLIEVTSAPPPAGAPPGPPPGLREAARKVQRGGLLLGVLVAVIVLLMVLKPTI